VILNKGYKLIGVSTKENNIPLGLTGALVVEIKKDIAKVVQGSFSCSIIGRDFEQKAILGLIEILRKEKIKELQINVSLTSTNVRVKEILDELGFSVTKEDKNSVLYAVKLDKYKPIKKYDWIKVYFRTPDMTFPEITSVINFFERYVKPVIKTKFKIANLGSAKGEVLGLMKKDRKEEFYKMIKDRKVDFKKIDLEYIPEEKNIVGDAEDLKKVISSNSQDLVMSLELLEHTEHFWRVINEMNRICKVGGYLLITVPSYSYPKHEYPIDLWRLGPKTLASFFKTSNFKIIKLETEGSKVAPRRSMIFVKKLKDQQTNFNKPSNGKINWKTGITIFP
jgi:SAM-dependent methyltransferase